MTTIISGSGIQSEIDFLSNILANRLSNHTSGKNDSLAYSNGIHSNYIFPGLQVELTYSERVILLLALTPHFQVNLIDTLIQKYFPQGGEFPEFGGVKSGNNRGMMPTGETAVFLLAGNDYEKRLEIQKIFSPEHFFYRQNILWLEDVKEGEPLLSGKIVLSNEWIDKILFGKISKPKFSPEFPARLIDTKMQWEDLVLHAQTEQQVNDMKDWLEYNHEVLADKTLFRKVKPGYRVLFYGPPGTGKTLTASLLGKQFHKDVYRVDLSQVVSKYIGETEKNLEKIFMRAENKDWILFFDEGDALFGKRTTTQSSNDKFANQEISYLLQRVEDFPGLIILASNFKNNIDPAFLRRFNALIYFPMPNAEERCRLWVKSMPENIQYENHINFKLLADKYELSGAAILNIIHYASVKAVANQTYCISEKDMLEGIRKEFAKEERTI